jgi:DNA-binding CsgD family transcriptional regulator/PAS domain-containing protein
MAKVPVFAASKRALSGADPLDGLVGSPPFAPPPARKHGVSPERSARVLGTLRDMSQATPDLDGCRHLLELISDEVRAEQAVLILSNPLTGELEFVVHNQDPTVPQRYAEYYCDLDPTGLPEYVTGRRHASPGTPRYAVSDLTEVVDYPSFICTEFYNDFLKSAKIHYDLVALGLHRPSQREPFSDEEIAILDLIAPFVGNHLERMLSASLRSVVPSSAGKGVIVCDPLGRVLFCNDIARRLCLPLHGSARPRLVAKSCFVGFTIGNADSLAGRCDVGVDSREVVLDEGTPARVITLESRDEVVHRRELLLKERYALTEREMKVLDQVMSGASNREISSALFIAECTVKKHIHSIGAKVGARSRTSIAHAVRHELDLVR